MKYIIISSVLNSQILEYLPEDIHDHKLAIRLIFVGSIGLMMVLCIRKRRQAVFSQFCFASTCTILFIYLLFRIPNKQFAKHHEAFSPSGVFSFFGIVCCFFESNEKNLMLYKSMEYNNQLFRKATLLGTFSTVILFQLIGSFFYLVYGHYTQQLFLSNFPQHSATGALIRLMFTLGLISSYICEMDLFI